MKKIVVLIFVVMAALSAKAQFYVGGNVALWHNDDADNTSFLIEPYQLLIFDFLSVYSFF